MNGKLSTMTFLVGLMLGCSCADRATKPETNDDTEERRLCVKNCDRQAACATEYQGTAPDADELASCQERCMDNWFREERSACHEEALRGLTCETEAMCPQLYAQGEMCKVEGHPFWACIADPESWVQRECTYDKCLAGGECCSDPSE